MTRIIFEDLPSTNTPRNAENLNKLNNVVISSTEPATGEEVWMQKGKNLCNITSVLPYNYGSGLPTSITSNITINSFSKNNINFTVNTNAYMYVLTEVIKLVPNTQYTLSYNRTNTNYSGSNSRCYVLNYDNGTYSMNGSLLVDNGTSAIRTFTTNSTGTIAIAWGFSNDGNGATVNISNIQIEQDTTATTYEEYIDKKIYTKNENGVYEEFYNENPLTIPIYFNETHIYSNDRDYLCFRIGNIVFLQLRTIGFIDSPENNEALIYGLPKPKTNNIFYLHGGKAAQGDSVRCRLNDSGEIVIHYGSPSFVGNSSSYQYGGVLMYETAD